MDLYILFVALFPVIVLSAWILNLLGDKCNLPGPTSLPIVGYFPYLTAKPHVKFVELSNIYGPLYKIRLGSKDLIVACNYETIREVLENKNFYERPTNLQGGYKKLKFHFDARSSEGWKQWKKLSQQVLRDIGMGKISGEPAIQEEITELMDRLLTISKSPVNLKRQLLLSTSSGVLLWLFGRKVVQNDPLHEKIYTLLEKSDPVSSLSWHYYFPWINSISSAFGLYSFIEHIIQLRKIFSTEIKHHKEIFNSNHINSMLDGYIKISNNEKNLSPVMKDAILEDLAYVFYKAGMLSIRSYIEWIFLVVAAFPEVQDRVQKEIDFVFGHDEFPSYSNRCRTPYTEAVIHETFRWLSMTPLYPLRISKEGFELKGYWIPKGTLLLVVLHSIMHDKSLFGEDVDTFRPERFLSEDGQKCIKPPFFIPFSLGGRSCPGKSHSEIIIYLYVTAILKKFRVSSPRGKSVNLECELGIGHTPKQQNLCFLPRQ